MSSVDLISPSPKLELVITERSMALHVAGLYEGTVLYNFDRSVFMHFDRTTGLWSAEKYPKFKEMISAIIDSVIRTINPAEKGGESKIVSLGSSKFRAGVEGFIKTHPRFAVSQETFDANRLLLGTPCGIIDLSTGEMLAHDPNHRITRSVSTAPADTPDCPQFLEFLLTSMDGKREMVAWMKRWLGYCLTGLTNDQIFTFFFGQGANGKSVLADIMLRLLGSYGKTLDASSLMSKGVEKHPTDIAALAGARFVVANEIEKDAKFAEARVKGLTSGDNITARFMRCDNFEFSPFLKLNIIGNHLPTVSSGHSMRRRMKIIPFLNRPVSINRHLADEIIQTEGPQVLRWLIDGAVEAIREGVGTCAWIEDYTDDFFSEPEDEAGFTPWFAAHVERTTGKSLAARTAYESYVGFVEAENNQRRKTFGAGPTFKPHSEKAFSHEMRKSLWVAKRTKRGMCYVDCDLRAMPIVCLDLDASPFMA